MDGGEPLAHVARGRNDVRPGDAVAGIDVEDDAVANVQMIDRRAAHMQFEHARLHQRKQPVEVFDRDDLPPFAVDHRAKTFLPEAGRGMLLEEALAARAFVFEVLVIAFAVSAAIFGAVGLAAAALVMTGVSRTTSRGGLSSRTPLNAAWRTMPSAVQPRRCASITVFGSTQRTSRRRASSRGI